jgi:hypothetical protein
MSVPALPRRLSAAPPAALVGSPRLADAAAFAHREWAALFAAVPVVTLGSLVLFALRDRGGANTAAEAGADAAKPMSSTDAPCGESGISALRLRPDEELALAGVVLAAMAERLERDPVTCPLLACAAARLVPESAGSAAGRWVQTGLTERACRAAVEILRPVALSTLVRAATWDLVSGSEQP